MNASVTGTRPPVHTPAPSACARAMKLREQALPASAASRASAAYLKFLHHEQRIRSRKFKKKSATETWICCCPFGADIRKRLRRYKIRMSEPGHQNYDAF